MTLDRSLRETFGKVSKLYDSVRESYPKELIDDIVAFSEIEQESQVLDIGCGSGQATLLFAERGYKITGIDLSKNLVTLAREKTKNFQKMNYLVGSLEETNFIPAYFDLIIAAQSWHWVDQKSSYQKVHTILKKDGSFAPFWKFLQFQQGTFLLEVKEMLLRLCPEFPPDFGNTAEVMTKRIIESKLFTSIERREYHATFSYPHQKFLGLIESYSWVQATEEHTRKKLIEEIKTVIDKEEEFLTLPYKYVLLVAKKRS